MPKSFELYLDETRVATFEYSPAGKRRCVAMYQRIQKANPDAKVAIVDRYHKYPRHFTLGKGVRKNIVYMTVFKSDGYFYSEMTTICFGRVKAWIRRKSSSYKIPDYITEPISEDEESEDEESKVIVHVLPCKWGCECGEQSCTYRMFRDF